MTSSLVIATRRGRLSSWGRTYSRIAMVSGSMLAILFEPNSTKNGILLELVTMPQGRDFSVGAVTSLISPVSGLSLPTIFPPCTVNQRVPFLSKIGHTTELGFGR